MPPIGRALPRPPITDEFPRDPGRSDVFGPLGFYEIVFILAIAFLLLGPRQMSVLSSNLGRMLREFYKATADVRRQVNAERAALEEEIRREQKPLNEALDEVKNLDRTVRKETEGAWSRRNVLGQNEPAPKVRPQALPEPKASGAVASTNETEESTQGPTLPQIRTPEGLTARGSLANDPAELAATGDTPAEPDEPTELRGETP